MYNSLVSIDWLKENQNDPKLIILDASQKNVQSGETSEHQNIRIPKARFFDLKNDFSDPKGKYPNTFPSPKQFEQASQTIGINQNSKIVIYDNLGVYTSPRAWWMFKAMGHDQVHVLDGGLPAWVQAGHKTENQIADEFTKGDFIAKIHSSSIKTLEFILSNLTDPKELLIDARSAGRFNGTSPEPREGLTSGNIAGSINIPFKSVLEDGKFKSKEALSKIFKDIPISNQPLIFSCGSGVTACIVLLAVEQILDNPKSVYDGSWTEWASEKVGI